MKFVFLDEGGEVHTEEFEALIWEEMTPEEQHKAMTLWLPAKEEMQ